MFKFNGFERACVAACALALSFTAAQAQPLIEEVPDDAVVYIGWNGVEGMGPQFEGSHLQGILKVVDVPRLGRDVMGMIGNFTALAGGGDARGMEEAMGLIGELSDTLWRYPTAFYFAGFEGGENGGAPRFALLCRMGDAAAPMAEKWNKLLAEPGSPPVEVVVKDGLLVVRLKGAAIKPTKSLKQSASFMAGSKTAVASSQAMLYVDVESVWRLVAKGIEKSFAPQESQKFLKFLTSSGLDGVKSYTWSAGFEGKSWATRSFTHAPAPRRGLAAIYDAPPVSDEMLKLVPMTASWFSAWRFDLAKLYGTVRQGVGEVEPQALKTLDDGLAQLKDQMGIDVDGLLGSLGDQWVLYDDQSLGGGPAGASMVLIHKLKDAPRFAEALAKIEAIVEGLLQNAGAEAQLFSLQKIQSEGMDIRSISIVTMALSWSVHEGRLYFGLFPQSLVAAADNATSGRKSILDQPKYQELIKQLGPQKPRVVSYDDLQWTAGTMYQSAVMLAQLAQGMGGNNDGQARPLVLPPLGRLLPFFHPAGHVSWADDDGYHTRGYSPFPGSRMFSPQVVLQSGVPVTAMSIGILLPSLGRARELANRSVAGTRLNGIYKAMNTYSVANNEQFPPDLGTLIKDGSMSYKQVINPRADDKAPPPDDDLEAQADWVNENSDFVIRFGKVGPDSSADEIAGYEKIQPGVTEGLNILFGDGHVAFYEETEALELLREAGEDVPDELPGKKTTPWGELFGLASPSTETEEGSVGNAWYYDTVAKEYFQDKTTQVAPFKRPNGNEAVRAHFFTCGDCVDGERFVGYYEKYTDEVRKELTKKSESFALYEMAFQGRLYSADGVHWFPAEKPEGTQITADLQKRCPPKKLRYCPPMGPNDKIQVQPKER